MAAPKLNPEGLLAAAREEKAKKDAAAKKAQQVGADWSPTGSCLWVVHSWLSVPGLV